MADPNAEEECYGTGTFTVVTQNDKLTCLHKPGKIWYQYLKKCLFEILISLIKNIINSNNFI